MRATVNGIALACMERKKQYNISGKERLSLLYSLEDSSDLPTMGAPWFKKDTWRSLKTLASIEPFSHVSQPAEHCLAHSVNELELWGLFDQDLLQLFLIFWKERHCWDCCIGSLKASSSYLIHCCIAELGSSCYIICLLNSCCQTFSF